MTHGKMMTEGREHRSLWKKEQAMMQAGVGLSTHKDTSEAAREASQTDLSRAGIDRADLALVFATADHGAGYSRLLRTVQTSPRPPMSGLCILPSISAVCRLSGFSRGVRLRPSSGSNLCSSTLLACLSWLVNAQRRSTRRGATYEQRRVHSENCQGYGPACCFAQTADRAARRG